VIRSSDHRRISILLEQELHGFCRTAVDRVLLKITNFVLSMERGLTHNSGRESCVTSLILARPALNRASKIGTFPSLQACTECASSGTMLSICSCHRELNLLYQGLPTLIANTDLNIFQPVMEGNWSCKMNR
jgi:hypothetical protein